MQTFQMVEIVPSSGVTSIIIRAKLTLSLCPTPGPRLTVVSDRTTITKIVVDVFDSDALVSNRIFTFRLVSYEKLVNLLS